MPRSLCLVVLPSIRGPISIFRACYLSACSSLPRLTRFDPRLGKTPGRPRCILPHPLSPGLHKLGLLVFYKQRFRVMCVFLHVLTLLVSRCDFRQVLLETLVLPSTVVSLFSDSRAFMLFVLLESRCEHLFQVRCFGCLFSPHHPVWCCGMVTVVVALLCRTGL